MTLPAEEQRRVCIFASNYGEAGAIDLLGHLEAGRGNAALPPAISGQNNYWLWGTHGCDPNEVIAVIDGSPEQLSQQYVSVQVVGRMDNPWAMPFEHKNIYLLRQRRSSVPFQWRDERFYN